MAGGGETDRNRTDDRIVKEEKWWEKRRVRRRGQRLLGVMDLAD